MYRREYGESVLSKLAREELPRKAIVINLATKNTDSESGLALPQ